MKPTKNLIEIHFDGGCKPTNPGNKYGSFEVLLENKPVYKALRFELGYGTSNEAEFDSLFTALEWTIKHLFLGGFTPSTYVVNMYTDSTILAARLKDRNCGGKGEASKRIGELTRKCLERLNHFNRWQIEWNGRGNNVARFGH